MTDDDAAPTVSRVMSRIPDPQERPTVSVEEAGTWFGLGRSAAYVAAARGELPTLRFNGHTLRVPVAAARTLLGLPMSDEPVRMSDEPAESCDRAVTSRTDSLVGALVSAPRGTENRTPR